MSVPRRGWTGTQLHSANRVGTFSNANYRMPVTGNPNPNPNPNVNVNVNVNVDDTNAMLNFVGPNQSLPAQCGQVSPCNPRTLSAFRWREARCSGGRHKQVRSCHNANTSCADAECPKCSMPNAECQMLSAECQLACC